MNLRFLVTASLIGWVALFLFLAAGAHAQQSMQPYSTINSAKKPVGDGSSGSAPMPVQIEPGTSGGLSVASFIIANNTTSLAVKNSAGQIYMITGNSISPTTPVFIKTYNLAQASNTCGANTPKQREMIPAPTQQGGGTNINYGPDGVPFSTAISLCVTAGQADADTTAPAANTYIVNVYYK